MTLRRKSFAERISPLILAFTTAAVLAGCGGARLGPEAETEGLKGSTTVEQVYEGGLQQHHTTLSAQFLKAKETYKAEGKLTIKGDVASHVTLQVGNGKLFIDGDVGDGVRINVDVPVKSHTETRKYSGYCYGYDFMSGKFEYTYKFNNRCSETKTVIDGQLYKDQGAVVEINGTVGKDVRIETYGKIVINGQQVHNQNQLPLAR